MRPADQDLGGADGADAGLGEQLRCELCDECSDLVFEFAFLEGEVVDAADVLPLWRPSRLSLPTSSTRSPCSLKKRARPLP